MTDGAGSVVDPSVERSDRGADREFRKRVEAFLAANAKPKRSSDEDGGGLFDELGPAEERERVAEAQAFQARLFEAGLAGITWPKQYGGAGRGDLELQIFNEVASAFELPTGVFMIGHGMCGPTLLVLGTEEQRRTYIPPMLRGDQIWCQLFSEPGAGSDVASLQTRAVRDGEQWVVNGQKVWTSGAHYSKYGMLIARTDVDVAKHRGLTMFVVDMSSPGVQVRPLRQITGGANFNEVFFTDVRVPVESVVGSVGEGWRAAITMLMNERMVGVASQGGGGALGATGLGAVIRLVRQVGLNHDPVIRQRVADIWIRTQIMRYTGMRLRASAATGRVPGPEGSIAKLYGAQLGKDRAALALDIAGVGGVAWSPSEHGGGRWAMAVLAAPAGAIAGGTDQVQRNIIGERVLGLPKEPEVDRERPFRDLLVGTQPRR